MPVAQGAILARIVLVQSGELMPSRAVILGIRPETVVCMRPVTALVQLHVRIERISGAETFPVHGPAPVVGAAWQPMPGLVMHDHGAIRGVESLLDDEGVKGLAINRRTKEIILFLHPAGDRKSVV